MPEHERSRSLCACSGGQPEPDAHADAVRPHRNPSSTSSRRPSAARRRHRARRCGVGPGGEWIGNRVAGAGDDTGRRRSPSRTSARAAFARAARASTCPALVARRGKLIASRSGSPRGSAARAVVGVQRRQGAGDPGGAWTVETLDQLMPSQPAAPRRRRRAMSAPRNAVPRSFRPRSVLARACRHEFVGIDAHAQVGAAMPRGKKRVSRRTGNSRSGCGGPKSSECFQVGVDGMIGNGRNRVDEVGASAEGARRRESRHALAAAW